MSGRTPLALRIRPALYVLCAATLVAARPALCQQSPKRTPPVPTRPSLVVSGGMTFIVSKDELVRFWNAGPAGSLIFFVPVDRALSIGLALEGGMLPFDESAFYETYPGVAPKSIDLGLFNIHVLARWSLMPSMRTRPYVDVGLGASHVTEGLYKEIIGGVRQIYYDVQRATRLSASAGAGLEIGLSPGLALVMGGRSVFVVDDPDVGIYIHGTAGMRFRL